MKRSAVFRTSAINKSISNWYKEMPLGKLLQINRNVDKILQKDSIELNYRRVYIPKGETFRPLGVPSKD
jgi:hypothetical protein